MNDSPVAIYSSNSSVSTSHRLEEFAVLLRSAAESDQSTRSLAILNIPAAPAALDDPRTTKLEAELGRELM